jgi:hypothetical protein
MVQLANSGRLLVPLLFLSRSHHDHGLSVPRLA